MNPTAVTITAGGIWSVVVATVAVVFLVWVAVSYNRLIRQRNLVREGWSGIDVQLKRRHELVPNLVACVTGIAGFERSVLEDVTRLRSAADASKSMHDRNDTENRLTGGLKSFFAVVESYPDLKANTAFVRLSEQLVEVEDAIQYSRRYYNGAVRDLNITVESFPSNLVAAFFGFPLAEYFEVSSVTQRLPPSIKLYQDNT